MSKKIMETINTWDPIDFFPMAPKDEYFEEIRLIEEILLCNAKITAEELAASINEIFSNSFGTDVYNKSIEDCIQVAKEILN